MDDIQNGLARALIAGLTMAVLAVAIAAVVRFLLFVIDAPGWWVLVLGFFLGGFMLQWRLDHMPEPPSK